MKTLPACTFELTIAAVLAIIVSPARADNFGTAGNEFTIDFVNVGNAGNADDAAFDDTAPDFSSPYGGVSYAYRMGTFEISENQIAKATASGLVGVVAGGHTGNQPAGNMTWYEAAAFVNFLNTSTGHQAAYQLDAGATTLMLWSSAQAWQLDGQNLYRHKDAFYFLPNEDEWYKAGFHKNDGATANFWDYATGSSMAPTAAVSGTASGTAIYGAGPGGPAAVNNAGGLSPYGTMGQNGNITEWQESALDGINNSPSEIRTTRGGYWSSTESFLRSSIHDSEDPAYSAVSVGFRVGSVPEPTAAVSLLLGLGIVALRRSRRAPGTVAH